MRILVVGGTGVVGRYVGTHLLERGHAVAVLSRRGGARDPRIEPYAGDLSTGTGVAAALRGVECVIDCANVATMRRERAVEYFTRSTRTLGTLAAEAGVKHHVVLSIVGVDLVPTGYYAGKLAQERTVLSGPVAATVLRATQFHEFAGQLLDRMRLGPVRLVPAMRSQPIAATEVAAELADLAEGPALGRARDVGGPAEESVPAMARAVARRRGLRGPVLPLPVPGAAGRAVRRGGLLLDTTGVARGPSFAQWLAASDPAA